MGGSGSGRQPGKRSMGNMNPLDIRRLHRAGLLTPGRVFSWQWRVCGREVASIQIRSEVGRVILDYQYPSHDGGWHKMEYPVHLEWTDCTLGGRRVWFQCLCGRRVAILYSGRKFACRHCHNLAYECQRETYDDRAMRRADKIRVRLGWRAGIANPIGSKPKGMHWRTYLRLMNEYNTFANVSWAGTAERLGLLHRRLDDLELALSSRPNP